jgi:hypothetical protein
MFTDLLDSLHKVVLIRVAQSLNLVDDVFVILALDGNRNREPAHDQCVPHAMVFRHSLQVGNFERGCVLVEDIGEILDQ